MLKCSEIEKITFRNNGNYIITKMRIDPTPLEAERESCWDLKEYLTNLLEEDGLTVCSHTMISIEADSVENSIMQSEILIPAIWLLDQHNFKWLKEYYRNTGIENKIDIIVKTITKHMNFEKQE